MLGEADQISGFLCHLLPLMTMALHFNSRRSSVERSSRGYVRHCWKDWRILCRRHWKMLAWDIRSWTRWCCLISHWKQHVVWHIDIFVYHIAMLRLSRIFLAPVHSGLLVVQPEFVLFKSLSANWLVARSWIRACLANHWPRFTVTYYQHYFYHSHIHYHSLSYTPTHPHPPPPTPTHPHPPADPLINLHHHPQQACH